MEQAPSFSSSDEFRARKGDVDFWWPHIAAVLRRHGLIDPALEPEPGHNPTNPTFVYGDIIVKLYGFGHWWRTGWEAERAAHAVLATAPEIAAPRLIADGLLYDCADDSWAYLITTRMPGVALPDAELSDEQKLAVARDLGRQVRRLHALPPRGLATRADWPVQDVQRAVAASSLPDRFVAQVDGFLSGHDPLDDVVTHGDLCGMHVFVQDGRFAGIIDWGDAMIADRHYEVIQPLRDLDMFCFDKTLLRAFLEASDWPVDADFPRKALCHACYRQAIGLTQHHTIDVFYGMDRHIPLDDITTLDELADALFDVS